MNKITRPQISIDRASKQYAIFDCFSLVKEFVPYKDEQVAIAEAKEWLKEKTTVEPELVYPVIRKMRMS